MAQRKKFALLFCILLSLSGYLLFGYQLQRENFPAVGIVYLILFASYIFLVTRSKPGDLKWLLAAAILFRFIFILSLPSLSDDYFRFVWDGKMITLFHNPFTVLPSTFISHSNQVNDLLKQLYSRMNSADYYTVYPPVCQFIFSISAWLFPNNLTGAVAVLHLFCLIAEVGSIFLISKLLNQLQLPEKNVLWYALNPLVIIELCGNLHFEAVMIFFLLFAIFLLWKRKSFLSAVAFGLAVSTKLIPLLFLPFLIKRLRSQAIFYFLVTAFTCIILFLPFLDKDLISNISSSIDLYFQKFEFNASIYYLIRWIGFQFKGYNIIDHAGPVLAIIVFISVMLLAIKENVLKNQNFFRMLQWSLSVYLALATTVHPWYVVPLVMMSVFTGFKYPVVWSLFIFLSYATYQTIPYHENLWLTAVEYTAVTIALLIETIMNKNLWITKIFHPSSA